MVDSFEVKRRVKEFIRENKMLEEGDGVLAAVSGGADSVCLLLVLNELKEELGIRLAAFHLNHGLSDPLLPAGRVQRQGGRVIWKKPSFLPV